MESSDHKGSDSTYTVHKGDTLSKIVYDHNKKYGTNLTVAEVAKKNGIKDPNKIFSGQQINLGLNQTSETQKPTDNFTGYSEATKKKLERDEQNLSPRIPNGQNINSQNVSVGEEAGKVQTTQGDDSKTGFNNFAVEVLNNVSTYTGAAGEIAKTVRPIDIIDKTVLDNFAGNMTKLGNAAVFIDLTNTTLNHMKLYNQGKENVVQGCYNVATNGISALIGAGLGSLVTSLGTAGSFGTMTVPSIAAGVATGSIASSLLDLGFNKLEESVFGDAK